MEQKQREKLLEARAWIQKELDTCINFWLKTAWIGNTAASTPALIGKGRSIPPIKVCGCRGAAAGFLPGCVRYTARRKNGWQHQNPALTLWRSAASIRKQTAGCTLP